MEPTRATAEVETVVEGEAGDAVEVLVAGRPAEVRDGRFRARVPLVAGRPEIRVEARDGAGNTREESLWVKSDPAAPVLTVTSPVEGAVVGSTPVVVTGTAVDDDLVSVTVGGVAASLSGSGFTGSALLVEGSQVISVVAVDGVGNSATVDVSVVLDTVPPVVGVEVGGSPLVPGTIFAAPVTPEVVWSDATAVTLTVTLDGAAFVPGTTVSGEGAHQLEVLAQDAAGNPASVLVDFEIRSLPPVFAEVSPADGTLTSDSSVVLEGRVSDAVTVEVTAGAQAPVAASLVGEDFSAGPFALGEGETSFGLLATGPGGATGGHTVRVSRDSVAPAVVMSQPADGVVVGSSPIVVSGTASDPHLVGLTVNGVAASFSGTSWLAGSVPLVEGDNLLVARAVDGAGNVGETSRTVVLDSRAPEVEITDPAPGTVVPADRDRVRPGGTGPIVKLPLGVHGKSGRRCSLLDAEGQPLADPYEALRGLKETPAAVLDGRPPAEEPAKSPDRESKLGPRASRMISGCRVLGHLVRRAEETSYLNHRERTTLLCTLGHLGREGREALHSIIGKTYNYRHEVTDRHVDRLLEFPISCPKVKELHPETTAGGLCQCPSGGRGKAYPSPVLQVLQPFEVPAFRRSVKGKKAPSSKPKPQKSEGAVAETGRSRIEEMVRKLAELRRHRRGLDAAIRRVSEELTAAFDAEGEESLSLSMGTLRKGPPDDEGVAKFTIEI